MGDTDHHGKIAEQNTQGAMDELSSGRSANVGLLSLRALEQMIEACAAKEGLHFHERPRSAHLNRRNWLETHHPDLLGVWDELWDIYGALGYGGLDGERAKEAITVLRKALTELSGREKIAIKGL